MARTTNGTKVAAGVYRLPCGRMRIRIYVPHQLERTLEGGTTVAQAIAERRRWRSEELADEAAAPAALTVASYAQLWISRRTARRSTLTQEASALECHVLPWIGHIPVAELRRGDILDMLQHWGREKKENGALYSQHTIRTWWRLARNMLRDLVVDEGIADPTVRVRVKVDPKGRDDAKRERGTLSPEELARLLQVVDVHYPDRYVETLCLALGGMRPGELYALTWADVDGPRRTLHVRHSVARGQVNSTKTGDPRDVVVPELVIEWLDIHRRQMLRGQHPGVATGLVFPSRRGTHRTSAQIRKRLVECGRLAGVEARVTPQVLRRTYNTLLVAAGIDRLVLRSQIGHTSEEMTSRYAGIRREQKEAAARALEQMITDE